MARRLLIHLHMMKSIVLASSLLALGACTDSMSKDTSITSDEYDDVARSVASSAATGGGGGDVGAMTDTAMIATGTMPLGFTLDVSGSIKGTHLGVTYSYMLTCKDVNGTVLPVCTALTDNANASLSWQGSLTLPNFSASVDRTGNWTLTGLQTAQATFNGDAMFSYDAMIDNPVRNTTVGYHFDDTATYDAIVVNTGSHLAVGGQINYDITASKDVNGTTTRSFSLSAQVTINADSTATIVLDGTHHYTLNLSTGVVVTID